MHNILATKDTRTYMVLTTLVICGLAASIITASKVVHFGVNFPFSNIVFAVFTYPIVDCICELWGKSIARQTIWFGVISQFLITLYIQVSIYAPHAAFWNLQNSYQSILNTSIYVAIASLVAYTLSQILDVIIYQRIKEVSNGKWLWLRSNVSICLGEIIDSLIFVLIVFHGSNHKFTILLGSITIKIILSVLMTPIVYLIVISINHYLGENTLAFKGKVLMSPNGE